MSGLRKEGIQCSMTHSNLQGLRYDPLEKIMIVVDIVLDQFLEPLKLASPMHLCPKDFNASKPTL